MRAQDLTDCPPAERSCPLAIACSQGGVQPTDLPPQEECDHGTEAKPWIGGPDTWVRLKVLGLQQS